MKYIITVNENKEREIFVFPNSVPHDVMAEAIERMKDKTHGDWRRITRTPLTAGFINGGVCHGKSESLGLSSSPEDTAIFRAYSL